jgi:hypothetical protein
MSEPLLRNISDTARWVATYRADESERDDALFHDPFARRLAGERGLAIASSVARRRESWPFVTRTWLFDHAIADEVTKGASLVLNLAAGLDTRPYRMALPEGPGFFEPLGWRALAVHSIMKTAARLGRVSWFLRLLAKLPESSGAQGSRPWSGVCLLGR